MLLLLVVLRSRSRSGRDIRRRPVMDAPEVAKVLADVAERLHHTAAERFVAWVFPPANPEVLESARRRPEDEACDPGVDDKTAVQGDVRGVVLGYIVLEEEGDVA